MTFFLINYKVSVNVLLKHNLSNFYISSVKENKAQTVIFVDLQLIFFVRSPNILAKKLDVFLSPKGVLQF